MLGFCYRVDKELSAGLTEEGARQGEFVRWDVGRERRLMPGGIVRPGCIACCGIRASRGWRAATSASGEPISSASTVLMKTIAAGDRRTTILAAAYAGRESASIRSSAGRRRITSGTRDPSAPKDSRAGPNIPYFLRRAWLTRCRNGMVKRPSDELMLRVAGEPTTAPDELVEFCRVASQQTTVGEQSGTSKGPRSRSCSRRATPVYRTSRVPLARRT